MRFQIFAVVAVTFALPLVSNALAQTGQRHAPPKITETQDADTKAEYLESIPYKPCPASVLFPNGQHACLGAATSPNLDVESHGEDRSDREGLR
jgi:hypothetical protein